jgi:hypothetical protein
VIAFEYFDPGAEAALGVLSAGLVIACFALYALARVLRDVRRRQREEWLMLERLARWRRNAESAAAGGLAETGDTPERGPAR